MTVGIGAFGGHRFVPNAAKQLSSRTDDDYKLTMYIRAYNYMFMYIQLIFVSPP